MLRVWFKVSGPYVLPCLRSCLARSEAEFAGSYRFGAKIVRKKAFGLAQER